MAIEVDLEKPVVYRFGVEMRGNGLDFLADLQANDAAGSHPRHCVAVPRPGLDFGRRLIPVLTGYGAT